MTSHAHRATIVLRSVAEGASAADELVPLIYDELKDLASAFLRRERRGHTLQTTALVHEAYLRLIKQENVSANDRLRFFAIAANVIRRILVDHARAKNAKKRGGEWHRLTLANERYFADKRGIDVVELSDLLDRLSSVDARQARVVELRFFGGLNIAETAQILSVSLRTVSSEWRMARAWLLQRLSPDTP